MAGLPNIVENPTQDIDLSFSTYVEARNIKLGKHLEGGIPDYAYASDYQLRQKLKAMPGAYAFFKAITNTVVPFMKQLENLNSVKVSPNQFPRLHAMVCACADILGIGVPTIYVTPNIGVLNACAYCVENADPLIIINSSMLERLSDAELKAVIAHECGHIHNDHGIYNTAVEVITNLGQMFIPGLGQILALLTQPIRNALNAWSRAAEVTCDRAGVICCGESQSTESVQAKLLSGGIMGENAINIDEILKQYDVLIKTPVRLMEWLYSHPVSVRRILAVRKFIQSEVYYKWHPEQRKPGASLLGKRELEAECSRIISVYGGEKRRGG